MGILRLLFSLSVAAGHFGTVTWFHFPNPAACVEGFFAMSGFYMAMILEEKYSGRAGAFYLNRYLRLWPTFAVATLITVVVVLWVWRFRGGYLGPLDPWLGLPAAPGKGGLAYLFFSSLSLVGLDAGNFLSINPMNGFLRWTASTETTLLKNYMPVLQAWTLGVEFTFYLIAPFLVKLSDRRLWMIFVTGISARFALTAFGLGKEQWTYMFTPIELCSFCAGILAYRWYLRGPSYLGLALMATNFIYLSFSQSYTLTSRMIFCLSVAMGCPMLFRLSKNSRFDRVAGMLSYPVYVIHMAVLYVFLPAALMNGLRPNGNLMIIVTLAAAFALHWAVEKPLAPLRERIGKGWKKT